MGLRPLALAATACLLVTVGCIGDDGDGSLNDTDTDDGPPRSFQWTFDNRTGTVTGASVANQSTPGTVEQVEIANGTTLAGFVLNATNVDMTVSPPGCDSADCQHTAPAGGNQTVAVQGPEAGTWSVELTYGTTGVGQEDYVLVVGQRIPATGAAE